MPSNSAPFLAATSGLKPWHLRSSRFTRVLQGVYVDSGVPVDFRLRCRATLLLFPGAVLCARTAARLQNLPCDDDGVVHVCVTQTTPRTRRAEVVVNRLDIAPSEIRSVDGMSVTDGPRTLADLAAHLTLVELTCVADRVAARYEETAIAEAVTRAWGRPGVVNLREAVRRADPRSDSPAETRMRLRLHDAGFTRMQHGAVVRDESGEWLAAPDLADPVARVAVQHEGAIHFERGRRQWLHDLERDELTRAAGWELVISTARDDADPELLLRKVSAAYRRSAARGGEAVLPEVLRRAA